MIFKNIINYTNVSFPIIYIWSTPLLSIIGFCNNKLEKDNYIGYSLSRFIATPQATGLMAVSFFSVANIMISNRYYKAFEYYPESTLTDYIIFSDNESKLKYYYIFTGILYECFFGSFLSSPITVYPISHCISVACFSCAAYIHIIILQNSSYFTDKWTISLKILKLIGTISFLGISICFILSLQKIRLPVYLFWTFECSGLTSFILIMNITQMKLEDYKFSIDDIYNSLNDNLNDSFNDKECFNDKNIGIEI